MIRKMIIVRMTMTMSMKLTMRTPMRMTTIMASVRMAMVRCIPPMHLLIVEADHRDDMEM